MLNLFHEGEQEHTVVCLKVVAEAKIA